MAGEQVGRGRGRLLLRRWLKGKEIGTALGFPKNFVLFILGEWSIITPMVRLIILLSQYDLITLTQ